MPEVRYGQIDRTYAERLATTPPDDDGPVWMVNLLHYRPVADYAEGPSAGAVSGREADERYTPRESLAGVGAEIVFVADVDQQLLGEAPKWDRVAVVKYPSRRAFLDMQRRPDYQRQHVHKDAALAATIVMGCQPMPTPDIPPDLAQPMWEEVPHPPTADDPYVVVLHVLRYKSLPVRSAQVSRAGWLPEGKDAGREHTGDRVGRTRTQPSGMPARPWPGMILPAGSEHAEAASATPAHMVEYQSTAGRIALRHGVRVPAWFAVEGTIVGDGRSWHQARFNAFPSKEAFMAVVFDPERLQAQADHREAAIADTYTMILRPTRDRLEASLTGA